jgi:nucleotide sugar dehydrogenase
MKTVVVIGQGYVGLPVAMQSVLAGHTVIGIENGAERLLNLRSGISYVEDVPTAELLASLNSGRYLPTDDYHEAAGFDVAIITVPTPLREGVPDLSFIESAAHSLAPFITPNATVILESTTYPGTTEELLAPLLETGSGLRAGKDFHVGYSPERIDPGNLKWNLRTTPKVVSGINTASLESVRNFYSSIVDEVVPVSGPKEAELAKLIENTFRHVNIALMNELAIFAHELGIDLWAAIDAASTKPFGYMRFTPGPGVGGHCLPIDPSYLSWRVRQSLNRQFKFVELANDINDHMPQYTVQRLTLALNRMSKSVRGSRVLMLGLTYKPNSSDARESPAIHIAQLLRALGAEIRAVDSHISELPLVIGDVPLTDANRETLDWADAVLIVTDHDDVDYDLVGEHASYVLDTRRRMTPRDAVEYL